MRPHVADIEVIRPSNPLAPPPRAGFVSPSLLDSLLGMLPLREEVADEVVPQAPLDLGFEVGAVVSQEPPAPEPEPEPEPQSRISRPAKPPPKNLQERLRGLKAAEQQRIARLGEQVERVALERIYGKAVWENLLRNPKISQPEVARIARMGTISKPLIETIVNNRAWLSSPQVRRALLQNRRLKNELIMTVLRATPKNELRLVPKQTAYSQAVREAAQKLIK